ncbi:hypothetical protein MMC12_008247 [Toensbergia leucococca]|nr:hypothetical protein [Toensbergia leucococca]
MPSPSLKPTSTPTAQPIPSTTPKPSNPTPTAHAAFTKTLQTLGPTHTHPLTTRATQIHQNAAPLTAQQTVLATSSSALAKQNEKLSKEAHGAREVLKEVGDVQNWAEVLEREFLVLEACLEDVEGDGEGDEGEGGKERWGRWF